MSPAEAGKTGPIILVGIGRCGSTLLHSLLSLHPDLAWISSYVDEFPRLPLLAAASRILDLPGMDRFRESRFVTKPVEPFVLSRVANEFYSEKVNETNLEDARTKIVPFLERVRRYHGRRRLLLKMVGRPVKIELLDRVLPETHFIHVTRDLMPAVSSMLKFGFYDPEEDLYSWVWDSIPAPYLNYFESTNRAIEVSVAIRVLLNLAEIERQRRAVHPSRWMEFNYAEFVADPVGHIREIGNQTGLPIDARFENRLHAKRIYVGANDKWKQLLDEAQLRNLNGLEQLAESVPLLAAKPDSSKP